MRRGDLNLEFVNTKEIHVDVLKTTVARKFGRFKKQLRNYVSVKYFYGKIRNSLSSAKRKKVPGSSPKDRSEKVNA